MVRQDYRIHEGGGRFGQLLFEDAYRKFKPNVLSQMSATWDAGLYHNPIMWGCYVYPAAHCVHVRLAATHALTLHDGARR